LSPLSKVVIGANIPPVVGRRLRVSLMRLVSLRAVGFWPSPWRSDVQLN
jgi:hypothetical protein